MHRLGGWSLLAGLVALLGMSCSEGGPSDIPVGPTLTAMVSYSVTLEQTGTVDLDTGTPAAAANESDLWFQAVTSNERYLTPENGARFALAGTSAPGAAWCRAAQLSSARIPIASLTAGRYLCGTTNRSNLVEIRIDEPPHDDVVGSGHFQLPTMKITITIYS